MRVAERLTWQDGALLVVDVQEKLLDRIHEKDRVLANSIRLVKAAKILGLPFWATEQYPKGLGPTVASLAELIPNRPDKVSFHCCSIPMLLEQLYARKIRHVTIVGIEAHVCVAQTSLELLKLGFHVQIPADAVGSRHPIDWEFALRRLERVGATVSTSEAVLFEWTESADHPRFKEISELVKLAERGA